MAAVSSTDREVDTWQAYAPRLLTRSLLDRNVPGYHSPDFSRSLSLPRSLALDDLLMSEAACMSASQPRRLGVLQRAVREGVLGSAQDLLVPDTVELLSALQGAGGAGRLGAVDGGQSCEDELRRRHEVPNCAAGETVKLRYLCETHAVRSVSQSAS
jgi:hypothetical protein